MPINTSLIQEQIDVLFYDIHKWSRIRDLCQTTVQLEGAKETIKRLEELRDQWLEILAAVEQQGNQEPPSNVTVHPICRDCKSRNIAYTTHVDYTSPVQPANKQENPQ